MTEKNVYFKQLSDAVYEMEEDEVVDIAKAYIEEGYDPQEAINHGLIDGMNRCGEAFNEEEYFVTDLLFAADTMYAALDFLNPYIKENSENKKIGKCVIGNVQGDTHDIGKNLVKTMMEVGGFEMIDLGRDVPVNQFVERAEEEEADLICISALMTTVMPNIQAIIDELNARGIRDKYKVMIGGGPVNQKFADEVGADGYSDNATSAVILGKELMGYKEAV